LPAISLDRRLGGQALPHQGLNFGAADSGHQAHGGKPGLIGRGFHGHHHLGLAGGATSRFAGFGGAEARQVVVNGWILCASPAELAEPCLVL
jgi:hypothetical protein